MKNKKIFLVIIFLFFVFYLISIRNRKKINENVSLNCDIRPILRSGQRETNTLAALYWNNTHGLIKTSSIWSSFGEVNDRNNKTQYKAFDTLRNGIKANLYNLLYYIFVLNIKKVSDIVVRWVGATKGSIEYANYLRNMEFDENCILDSNEKVRVFFTNQAIAENVKNDTNNIYNLVPVLWNEISEMKIIPNLQKFS